MTKLDFPVREVCVFWQKFWLISQFVRCWLLTKLSGNGWNQIGIFPLEAPPHHHPLETKFLTFFGVQIVHHTEIKFVKFEPFFSSSSIYPKKICLTQMQEWKVNLFCLWQLTFKNLFDCFLLLQKHVKL